jgi:hypothetical protein
VKTRLRGLFLTSEHPDLTARFYRDIAGLSLEQVSTADGYIYWKLNDPNLQLAIHAAKGFADYTYPAVRASNLTHLYFQIPDRAAFLALLKHSNLEPCCMDDLVVTVIDPDGRRVLFGTA